MRLCLPWPRAEGGPEASPLPSPRPRPGLWGDRTCLGRSPSRRLPDGSLLTASSPSFLFPLRAVTEPGLQSRHTGPPAPLRWDFSNSPTLCHPPLQYHPHPEWHPPAGIPSLNPQGQPLVHRCGPHLLWAGHGAGGPLGASNQRRPRLPTGGWLSGLLLPTHGCFRGWCGLRTLGIRIFRAQGWWGHV